jgi:hypothetical protein
MNRSLIFAFSLSLVGCAHTAKSSAIQTYTYLADSREDFMVSFEPTGSPCLDALQINLAHVGCRELEVGHGDDDGLTYLKCAGGSSGATDPWSNSTFTVLPSMVIPPDYVYVICVDPLSTLGILEE